MGAKAQRRRRYSRTERPCNPPPVVKGEFGREILLEKAVGSPEVKVQKAASGVAAWGLLHQEEWGDSIEQGQWGRGAMERGTGRKGTVRKRTGACQAEELPVLWDTDPIPETMDWEKVGRPGYGTKRGAIQVPAKR